MTKKLCIHPLFIIVCVEEKKKVRLSVTQPSVDVMGPDILITLILTFFAQYTMR